MFGHKSKKARKAQMKCDINITPFTDVVLVLLIVFMITTPAMVEGVKVKLPMARNVQEVQKTLVVYIQANGSVFIDKKEYKPVEEPEVLKSKLNAVSKKNKETNVVINADRATKYGFVVNFIDVARKAGLGRIVLGVDVKTAAPK